MYPHRSCDNKWTKFNQISTEARRYSCDCDLHMHPTHFMTKRMSSTPCYMRYTYNDLLLVSHYVLKDGQQLTHNVHGPHDDKFYRFLASLEDEYAALKRSGYAGEGFFSKGNRLGTNVSHNLPPYLARQKAIEAAETRRRINAVLGAGGRLGGARSNPTNKSPRELAAEVCPCSMIIVRETPVL